MFGTWQATSANDHYYLRGRKLPICGRAVLATGRPLTRGPYGPPLFGAACPDCVAINWERWQKGGA